MKRMQRRAEAFRILVADRNALGWLCLCWWLGATDMAGKTAGLGFHALPTSRIAFSKLTCLSQIEDPLYAADARVQEWRVRCVVVRPTEC